MLTKLSCRTSSAQSLLRVIRTATANSFADEWRYSSAKACWSRRAQRDSRSDSWSGVTASGRAAIAAFLPVDVADAGLAVEDAAKDEQQVGQAVQVTLQRARKLLGTGKADEVAFRAPAYGARHVTERG